MPPNFGKVYHGCQSCRDFLANIKTEMGAVK